MKTGRDGAHPHTTESDSKPKIGEHKVVRYLVGPLGVQNEDTRWWTFAFWPLEKLSPGSACEGSGPAYASRRR
jgi:hypothetical protein